MKDLWDLKDLTKHDVKPRGRDSLRCFSVRLMFQWGSEISWEFAPSIPHATSSQEDADLDEKAPQDLVEGSLDQDVHHQPMSLRDGLP